jgi:primosomal protein N' (replication factor Y)
MNPDSKKLYVRIVPPVKLDRSVIYSLPAHLHDSVSEGCQIGINLAGRSIVGYIEEFTGTLPDIKGRVKDTGEPVSLPAVTPIQMRLWNWIAGYYMCTTGEVYRAAYPDNIKRISAVKSRSRKTSANQCDPLPELLDFQLSALNEIKDGFRFSKPVYLRGEPASGKSEIYFRLASGYMAEGKSVLILVPDVSLCEHIAQRAIKYFGEKVLRYHSGLTYAERLSVVRRAASGNEPLLIAGVRSAVLIPAANTGLVIVDEEHDPSFKQFEPAPRYNARDVAMVYARMAGADALLGSSTPSFESLENIKEGKYIPVNISKRFFDIPAPEIRVTLHKYRGSGEEKERLLSPLLISAVKRSIAESGQILIVTPRKQIYYQGEAGVQAVTSIAAELADVVPDARVAIFDPAGERQGKDGKKIPEEFRKGKYDILVSSRSAGKGFHFPFVTVAALLFADSLISQNDFRSGEKLLQTVYQLAGRAGRESGEGVVIIQTSSSSYIHFRSVRFGEDVAGSLMKEREEFGYPPYKKLINIDIKGRWADSVSKAATAAASALEREKDISVEGPFDPSPAQKGDFLRIMVKFPKERSATVIKKMVAGVCLAECEKRSGIKVIFDVDPV